MSKIASAQIPFHAYVQLIVVARPGRRLLKLASGGNGTIFIGPDNTVTTANGWPLNFSGATIHELAVSGEVWMADQTGVSGTLNVLEVYDE